MSHVIGPELLARDGNLAVVKLPDRRFPGLLIQGDTLATIRQLFDNIDDEIRLPEEIKEVKMRLDDLLSYYETVLREQEIQLPY